MYKLHFIAIAKVMQRNRPEKDEGCWIWAPWAVLVDDMADYLATTNSNFDRSKFIEACNK